MSKISPLLTLELKILNSHFSILNSQFTKKREQLTFQCFALFSVSGDYLLSRFRSTIGATGLNFSVRNG